jgi:large subunit ribosomal protein L30
VAEKQLRITLVHSATGTSVKHKATVRALGLRHIRQVNVLKDTPAIRGMLAKVMHLVNVEEVKNEE